MSDKKYINNWSKEIDKIKKVKNISLPLNIFLEESAALSGFIGKYWEATADRPGLEAAAPIVGPETAGEILALVTAVSEAHAEAKRAGESDADTGGTSLRAKAWIREVQHLLSWAERQTNLSGGDPLSTDVQRLGRAYHKDKKNAASLAQWIINYSVAARENLAALATVPGFSEALLDEGDRLWKPLLAVRRGRPAGSDAYREALRRRRGLTHLLADRVRRVRSAARFVFRHHPDIRRQAMSEFERRRRQGQRKGT